MAGNKVPNDWCGLAHQLWLADDKAACVTQAVQTMNTFGVNKPKAIYEQLAYYLYLMNDYKSAAFFIEQGLVYYPDDHQMLSNLVTIYSSLGNHQKSVDIALKLIAQNPNSTKLYDPLCSSLHKLGDLTGAVHYGTQSLIHKDKMYCDKQNLEVTINLSKVEEDLSLKKKVIAYSLWGNKLRYINGALRNLILAKDIYPEWELWFYIDESVDKKYVDAFKKLGAVIHQRPPNQSIKQKLCWRFHVASHPQVGHFMVRDADSVINVREYHCVQEWLVSKRPFHILRDWWTHTDLILAGMWGGIAGVLPNIEELLEAFHSGKMETPHIDQWFLGQVIWPSIKQHSLIHDRYFNHPLSTPVPGINPCGNRHIGCCEYSQDSVKQELYLAPWKHSLFLT